MKILLSEVFLKRKKYDILSRASYARGCGRRCLSRKNSGEESAPEPSSKSPERGAIGSARMFFLPASAARSPLAYKLVEGVVVRCCVFVGSVTAIMIVICSD